MANFHSDPWIFDQLQEHYKDACSLYSPSQIAVVTLQGSQNYGLDYENSDVDTKCILVPSFRDIALNAKPVSTTHIRTNNEHIDAKDVRLYMETFRKQNLNFVEILFSPYAITNPRYVEQWNRLLFAREDIAHMNPFRAVKTMKGIALEKYHAMEHPYPSKIDIIAKYQYDPKQVSHLVRVEEYLERYINGEPYEACLHPKDKKDLIINLKMCKYTLEEAREIAKESLDHVTGIADRFCAQVEDREDLDCRELLNDVSYNIMKISVMNELQGDEK